MSSRTSIKTNGRSNGKRSDYLIHLESVAKSYQTEAGNLPVLKNINLNIGKGEFVGVIGKSGSGKSTLINMITGIDRPSSGKIWVADTPIHTLSEGEIATWRGLHLGIVFQFFQLLPTLTVIENVMLPMDFCHMYAPEERPQKALQLLKLVDIEEQAYKLPSQLSGGQQQRAAIARALANDPPIIVADEPTGNLDSKTAQNVFDLFEQFVQEGKTIVMVTHDIDLAKRVNRAIIISDGEVIEEYLSHAFPNLTEKQQVWITSKLQILKYSPGEVIIKKGEILDQLYIVTKGTVEIVLTTPDKQEVVVAHFVKGQYFGEIELLRSSKSVATARAASGEAVELAVLDKPTFQELITESPSTAKQVSHIATVRLQENIATTKRKAKTK